MTSNTEVIGQPYPIAYVAHALTSGISDIQVDIYDPLQSHMGSALMDERIPGVYYHDFTPQAGDQAGFYTFVVSSSHMAHPHVHRRKFTAGDPSRTGRIELAGSNTWLDGSIVNVFARVYDSDGFLFDPGSLAPTSLEHNLSGSQNLPSTPYTVTRVAQGYYAVQLDLGPSMVGGFYNFTVAASTPTAILSLAQAVSIFDEETAPTSPPPAATTEVYGYIFDSSGNPIENAEARLRILNARDPANQNVIIEDKDLVAYTDVEGKFTFQTFQNVNFELHVPASDFAGRGKTSSGYLTPIANIILPSLL